MQRYFSAGLPFQLNHAALALISSLIVFSPLLDGGTTHLAVMIIRIHILLTLGLYLLSRLDPGRTSISFPAWPAILGFLVTAAYSSIVSPYRHQSIQWLVVLCSYAVLLYSIVFFVTRWEHVTRLLSVLIVVGVFEAAYALSQWWHGAIRPAGTFFNANFLAGYLASIWSIVFATLCFTRYGLLGYGFFSPWRFYLRIIGLIGILGTMMLAILSTGSRGGMLALIAGSGIVLAARLGRNAAGIVLTLLTVLALIPNPVRDRMWSQYIENPLGYSRWQIWESSLQAVVDHPLGEGLGLYQYVYPRYANPVEGMISRYGNVAVTSHNEYLQMAVELGVPGLLMFLGGIWLIGRQAIYLLNHRLERWQKTIVIGISAAVGCILVQSTVDSNLHEPAIAVLLTLCVGLLFCLSKIDLPIPCAQPAMPSWLRVVSHGCAVVVLIAMGWVTIQYGVAAMAYENGVAAAFARNSSQAISSYQSAISLDPQKALYHSAIGGIYYQMFRQTGDMEAAQSAVNELILASQLNPLDGRLAGLLGQVYSSLPHLMAQENVSSNSRSQWLRAAALSYEKAVQLEPYTPSFRFGLGQVLYSLGKQEEGEKIVRSAVEMEPNFLVGREWLSRLYLHSGRIELARFEYKEIVERQEKYKSMSQTPLEASFLQADASGLAKLLGENLRNL